MAETLLKKDISLANIPAFPAVVLRVLDIASQENPDFNLLVREITSDATLSAQVLRLANSPLFGCAAQTPAAIPYAVGLYITAAYWFTASTSFANPAVTIARALSDTYAGIAPADVLAFIAAQIVGMLAAVALGRWLWRK